MLRDGAFAHDLIYEAALASVPATVARQLHAEVAAFLQQRDGEPARLAHHWLQAGDPAQAGTAFNAAAERSRKASSLAAQCEMLAEAARCFELAGRPAERFDALLRRARTLASNDLGPDARAAVEAVEALATSDEQRLLALDARLELTVTRGEVNESLRLGDQAIAAARALGRPDLELRFAITVSGALLRRASRRRGGAAARAARALRSRQRRPRAAMGVLGGARAGARLRQSPRRRDGGLGVGARRGAARESARHAVEDDGQQRVDASQDGPGRAGGAARRASAPDRLRVERDRQHARAADAGHARPPPARRRSLRARSRVARRGARRLCRQRRLAFRLRPRRAAPGRPVPAPRPAGTGAAPARARSPRRAARRGHDPARAPRRARGADGARRPAR